MSSMTLQPLSDTTIGIKSSSALTRVSHDGTIQVGEKSTQGPGEYDISGVGVHIWQGAASLFAEGIRLTIIWKEDAKISSDEDAVGDNVVFLISNVKAITGFIKDLDPKIIILHHPSTATELEQTEGVTIERQNNYKFTPSGAEDTRRYILITK